MEGESLLPPIIIALTLTFSDAFIVTIPDFPDNRIFLGRRRAVIPIVLFIGVMVW
jgi:hypothetical protein